jgi:hypothetical protein
MSIAAQTLGGIGAGLEPIATRPPVFVQLTVDSRVNSFAALPMSRMPKGVEA